MAESETHKNEGKPGLFEKGGPGGPGRPPGTKALKRAAVVLADAGRHPINEMIALADATKDEDLKYRIWNTLQTFCEAPQKEPAKITPTTPEESAENAAALVAQLATLSKPLEPNAP